MLVVGICKYLILSELLFCPVHLSLFHLYLVTTYTSENYRAVGEQQWQYYAVSGRYALDYTMHFCTLFDIQIFPHRVNLDSRL